jgi:hypothetical protein
MDPNGTLAPVAELLAQTNEILDDIPWIEGNLPTGHRTTLRTSLPTVYWRRFNQGVLPSKSGTAQVDETVGMMEGYSEVDRELVRLYGNRGAAFRASEDTAFVESMNIEFSSKLFYGNVATTPEAFTGLATRFADVNFGESSSGAKDGAIVEGGGSGSDNTSIWLVVWGENTIHGIYPKGTEGGLQSEDLGENTKVDATGAMYQVLRSHFMWKCGIAVRDWRYVVRIANIDWSNLVANSSAANLIQLMIKAIDRVPNLNAGRPVFYAPRGVFTMLRVQALSASQYTTTFDEIAGRRVMNFQGIPIRKVDALLTTEAQLT